MRPATFDAAVVAQTPALRNNALKLTRDRAAADDLVQDTVEKALRYYESFHEGSNLSAWLYVVMRNVYYSQLKRARLFVDDPDGEAAAAITIPAEQEPRALFQQVTVAFDRLNEDHREVLMGLMDGLTYEEIARDCGTALGTVKSRVNRARARLTEMVG